MEDLMERFALTLAMLLKIQSRTKQWEGPPPQQAVDFLADHLPTNLTVLLPLHAKYLNSVPLLATFVAISRLNSDLAPLSNAFLSKERPVSVDLLKYLVGTENPATPTASTRSAVSPSIVLPMPVHSPSHTHIPTTQDTNC